MLSPSPFPPPYPHTFYSLPHSLLARSGVEPRRRGEAAAGLGEGRVRSAPEPSWKRRDGGASGAPSPESRDPKPLPQNCRGAGTRCVLLLRGCRIPSASPGLRRERPQPRPLCLPPAAPLRAVGPRGASAGLPLPLPLPCPARPLPAPAAGGGAAHSHAWPGRCSLRVWPEPFLQQLRKRTLAELGS